MQKSKCLTRPQIQHHYLQLPCSAGAVAARSAQRRRSLHASSIWSGRGSGCQKQAKTYTPRQSSRWSHSKSTCPCRHHHVCVCCLLQLLLRICCLRREVFSVRWCCRQRSCLPGVFLTALLVWVPSCQLASSSLPKQYRNCVLHVWCGALRSLDSGRHTK